jgi:hypothetical protein
MSWPSMLLRYAWVIGWRELMRSPRWTPERKAWVLMASGMLMSGPVTIATVWWLLTGRGPLRWLGIRKAFVNPFPRELPAEVRVGLEQIKNAGAKQAQVSSPSQLG